MLSKLIEDTKWSAEIRQCIGEVGITMGTEKGQALADAIKAQNATSMRVAYEEGRKAARKELRDFLSMDSANKFSDRVYEWIGVDMTAPPENSTPPITRPELQYCATCIQMTNHEGGTCLKCGLLDPKTEI